MEALPRETVTFRLHLQNDSDRRATFTPTVTPPMGWTVLVPPGEVRLEAGASRVVVFTLLVAAGAEAGSYVFPVTYFLTRDGPQRRAMFEARVPVIDGVTLTRLEAPAYVASERFTTRFLLRNDGNAHQAWQLTARSSASLPLELDPEQVELGPGDATEVRVLATVPADHLAASITHVVTLRAQRPDRPEVQVVARATSELIPRAPSTASALHTFPLTVRLALEASNDGTTRIAGPTVELSGTGPVHDRDPGRLTVRLKTALARPLAPEAFLVSYRDARTSVAVGMQAFSRSSLAATETGFGVHAQRSWQTAPAVSVTGSASAYASDAGRAIGAAVETSIEGGFAAGLQLHRAPDGSLVSVSAGYRAPVADPTRLELSLLEAAYALRSTPGQGALGQAFRVRAGLRDGPSSVDLRYRSHTAAFTPSGRHESTLDLRAALRLNDVASLDPSSPLHLHLAYGTEHVGPATGTSTEKRVRTFGATLTARLGRTGLSVGHREAWTQEGATATREGTSHLQAYLPLGEHASLRQRLSWRHADPTGEGSHLLYEATGVTATGEDGRLTANLVAGLALHGPHVDTLTLGARWSGPLSESWSLRAEGSVVLLGRGDVLALEGKARKRFANDHELELGVDLTAREARPLRATFAVAYAVPFQVPLGPRSDVGTIRGSVRTASGDPLAGVIVIASGATAVTGADGTFTLPAVALGPQAVHLLPSTVPVESPIVTPAPPVTIEVRAGEVAQVAFEVTPGATVAGRLVPEAAAGNDDRSVLPPKSDPARWLPGATVELTDGTRTLRSVTDAAGAFLFLRVPPGPWTLRLLHPTLPDDYRLEPTERQVQVRAGRRVDVEFHLISVQRAIRFQDGGRIDGRP
ncbi:MAG: hypothetical protein WD336_05205 [Trueperaceae bacterium]